MTCADPRRSRGGFTLAELMVALLITGFITATIFQILGGQSRVVAVQGAREETQQNTRGALEIVSSELRTAIPQGILRAEDRSITFMQPRAWGLVCGSTAAGSIDAIFPSTQALGAFTASAAAGVLVRAAGGNAGWQPAPALNNLASVQTVQVLGAGEAGLCAGATPMGAAGGVVSVRITSNWAIHTLAGGAGDARRPEVVLYALTQYDVAQVNGRWWLRRTNGVGGNGAFDQQPLAGPLREEEGTGAFLLTYFRANPDVPVAAPGTVPADLAQLRMVRVRVAVESQQRVAGHRQQDEGSVRVMLRNAR